MSIILTITSVTLLSCSIFTFPLEEANDDIDNDTPNLSQLVHNDYGLPKKKLGNAVPTQSITSLMSGEEINRGNDPVHIRFSRSGLSDKSDLWPNGRIPISVEGSYTPEERELLILAMDTIEYWTCIRFTGYDGQEDYVAIKNVPNKGCKASVGYQGGRHEIRLEAPKCFDKIGTVLHELLHTIGLIDEHRRQNRDRYVFIHENNVIFGQEKFFRKYTRLPTSDYGIPYDYNSVMHLPENAYSRNGQKTLEPIMRGHTIGQRDGMSVRDAIKVGKMYQCFFELNLAQNSSRILPLSNETLFPKDYLVDFYYKGKMHLN